MKYPVFICDDDQDQINQIVKILGLAELCLSDENKIEFPINSATNFAEAKKYLNSSEITGGIYFLDVELGSNEESQAGFDLAELVKNQDEKAQIIFVTSHSDLSIITYQRRLGPVDYIVKTPNLDELKNRIIQTLKVAIHQIEDFDYIKARTFTYRIGHIVRKVNINEVIYITTTSVPHKLSLILTTGEGQFLGSISEYAKNNPMFQKINQSCLVNPKNIASINFETHEVRFINGDVDYFSQSYRSKMKGIVDILHN